MVGAPIFKMYLKMQIEMVLDPYFKVLPRLTPHSYLVKTPGSYLESTIITNLIPTNYKPTP